MRTKNEIVDILAKRQVAAMLDASIWSDLVTAIQAVDTNSRGTLVDLIKQNRTKEAGDFLYKALNDNAMVRAKAYIESLLADDVLSLSEIDSIL